MGRSGSRGRSKTETWSRNHRRTRKISVSAVLGKPAGETVRVLITRIHSIVLENLSHRFLKPNILDIKLGTRLYDDEASEAKKTRMIQTAKNTTSFETGVRLTGFQVGNMQ